MKYVMRSNGEDVTGGVDGGVSRRNVLAGGGILFGSLVLQACAGTSRRIDTSLPEPIAPSDNHQLIQWAQSPTAPDGWNAPSLPIAPAQPAPTPVAVPDFNLPTGVLPRSMWTRAGVARSNDIHPIGGINRVTIHHDGMPPASLHSQGAVAARIEQIRQAHVAGRGWADIGYHYVVDPMGRVWEARNIRYQGAHVKDQNQNNLGILVLGNFEIQTPTPMQLAAVDRFAAEQMARYRVPMWRVHTHREIAQTACPGRNLQGYLVRTRMAGGAMMRMSQA